MISFSCCDCSKIFLSSATGSVRVCVRDDFLYSLPSCDDVVVADAPAALTACNDDFDVAPPATTTGVFKADLDDDDDDDAPPVDLSDFDDDDD